MRVQAIYHLPVAAGDQVPVNVHGHVNAGMPKLFLQLDRAGAIAEKLACEGVPDIVEANFPDTTDSR